MKKINAKAASGCLTLVVYGIIALLGLSLLVVLFSLIYLFIFFILGGLVTYLLYKYIKNEKKRKKAIIVSVIVSLLLGSIWIYTITRSTNSGQNINSKTVENTILPKTENKPKEVDQSKTAEADKTVTAKSTSDLYDVTNVTDGDTIVINFNGSPEKVRLIGINTPETVDPRTTVECFGQEASDKAKELLNGKKVKLESDPSQSDKDQYDRLLRYVYLEDGTFFNKLMIAEGYAYEYTYDVPYKYQVEFKEAGKQAKEQGKGLWNADTCNGQKTNQSVSQNNNPTPSTSVNTNTNSQNTTSSGPQVKKSKTSICHEKGGKYYDKTTNYVPYNTIQECLDSGGRLPKG